MKIGHKAAIFLAICVQVALVAGVLFGFNVQLEPYIGVRRTLREVSVALWAVLVPGWFALEARIFSPKDRRDERFAAFVEAQRTGHGVATLLGAVIAATLGTSAPPVKDVSLPASQTSGASSTTTSAADTKR